ncbi:MAG: cation diffusion facilitator family transporter [Mariprofundales bacterium]|nr:cation diffusion facilitator family transporter [Mariprofundales bacterium]
MLSSHWPCLIAGHESMLRLAILVTLDRVLVMDNHAHGSLTKAFWLTLAFALIEFGGGWVSGSLALFADAGHMLSDVLALGLAAVAGQVSNRTAHAGMTYGYGRASVLAAQVNGLALWFLSGWISWEAFGRLVAPPVVDAPIVMGIGMVGLLINLIVLRWLHGGASHSHHREEINIRAIWWHVMGDALGSVAAIVAGVVILGTGWMTIDPLLSFLIAAILAWGGWRLVRETTQELMEGTPEGVDTALLAKSLLEVEGIQDVHHIHLWRLPDRRVAFSAHLLVVDLTQWSVTLLRLQQRLALEGVGHATLQPELVSPARRVEACECAPPHG